MTLRSARASAPTRIDLAGGTLDIWPISHLVDDALTVNLAIDLRATAAVAPARGRLLTIVSVDRRKTASFPLPLNRRAFGGPLSWLVRLCHAFAPDRGLTLRVHATAPAGAGLGGSSSLGIAVAAALARATGEKLSHEELLLRVQNLETKEIRVPTGNQDYLAALYGGLGAYWHRVDGFEREALAPGARLAERLVLAYTGEPRASGYSNWDMFRRFVEREPSSVRRMGEIARLARAMRDALVAGRLDDAGRLLGEEGDLRFRLAPSVATPALRAAASAARRAGALGAKVCGAGGGGCLVAYAPPGAREPVATAIGATGAEVLPIRLAAKGVAVSGR